ncbi:MAG TPA: hypothetical protein VFB96_02825, partial [Pirellulaceae bacterium]|nr:hypothetical protein [Pirellulaceae bacterium]
MRSSAAIGQVVPCPKCGGMVLIKPPEPALSPEVGNAATKPVEQQAAAASPHNTKDFDDVESVLAGSMPAPVAAAPRSDRGAVAGESAPPAAATAAPANAAQTAVPAAGGPHAAPRPPLDASEVPTSVELSAGRPVRYGMWLAISILAGVGLAVAVVVVSTWLLQDGKHHLPIDRSFASSSSSPGAKADSTGKPASETGRAEKTAAPAADAT